MEDYSTVIHIKPRGKPTMTQKTKWSDRNQDYLNFYCAALRAGFNRTTKFDSATQLIVNAFFKTKDESKFGQMHDQDPDLSNIIKGVEDALLIEDHGVALIAAGKFWGPEDRLEITLHVP